MPAGLDGNPDPVVTPEREDLLEAVADVVCRRRQGRSLVAVDGRSGAGKSTFADELADRLGRRDVAVVRSTTDSFHRPRRERLARGPSSAEGFYLDSHQLDVIVGDLLEPFARGHSRVRVAAFDEPSDSPVDESVVVGPGRLAERPLPAPGQLWSMIPPSTASVWPVMKVLVMRWM